MSGHKKDNARRSLDSRRKKGLIIFAKCVITLIVATILLFTPDFILIIRKWVSTVLRSNYVIIDDNTHLNAGAYVEMMLAILSCLISALLTYAAFCLSKALGNIQVENHEADELFWATEVYNYIHSNLQLIKKAVELESCLKQLNTDEHDHIAQYIAKLYSAEFISGEEYNILTDCRRQFRTIKQLVIDGDMTKALSLRDQIISQHIILAESDLTLRGSMKETDRKLKKTIEECVSDA